MEKTKLTMDITKLQRDLRKEIPNLNRGGCGLFAYLLGKRLKREGIDFKIKILGGFGDCFEYKVAVLNEVKNNRNNLYRNQASFAHCYLQIGDYKFDGHYSDNELREVFYTLEDIGEYSLQDLYLAIKVGGWNWKFCLKRDLPKLEEIIENFKIA